MSDLTGLIEIAQIITGFECDRMCSLVHEYEYIQPATVKTVYEDMGVRWTPIVESDVLRILQGEKPQYFMHWDSWVNTYRRNHHVSTSLLNQSNFEFVYGG